MMEDYLADKREDGFVKYLHTGIEMASKMMLYEHKDK